MTQTPYLLTPTPDSREAFVRAAHAANMGWCSAKAPVSAAARAIEIGSARADDTYIGVHLDHSVGVPAYRFIEDDMDDIQGLDPIKTNSPRHFIALCRRLKS